MVIPYDRLETGGKSVAKLVKMGENDKEQTDEQTDRQTDIQTDGRTDRQTDRQTEEKADLNQQ